MMLDITDIQMRGQIDTDRSMVMVDIVHTITGKVLGSGMIPIWCSGDRCQGCDEAHDQGDG